MTYNNRFTTSATGEIVAWDVETCPLPDHLLTDVHRERLEKEIAIIKERQPDLDEAAARRLAMSTHPFLGWICCISAVAGTLKDGCREPVSFHAPSIDEEKALLERFWEAIGRFPGKSTWVTFNGKKFDVPFLLTRSAHYGVSPSRFDLADTYPYNHRPHADLCGAWPCYYTLHDLCGLLGVSSSKNGLDGSMVAGAVDDGRIDEVVDYCEADVVATWTCYRTLQPFLK
jgi:hypothetical protein